MTITVKDVENVFREAEVHVDRIHKSRRLMDEYVRNYYKHPFFPCIRDRGIEEIIRWGCELHPMVQNKHFDTIVHHMLFFESEKHKEYIIKGITNT